MIPRRRERKDHFFGNGQKSSFRNGQFSSYIYRKDTVFIGIAEISSDQLGPYISFLLKINISSWKFLYKRGLCEKGFFLNV